jgi:hypothetical protein
MFDGRESKNSFFYLARIRLLYFRGLALPIGLVGLETAQPQVHYLL